MTTKIQTKNQVFDLDKIRDIALDNIEFIFSKLGIENYSNRYSYLTTSCPIHKGDNKTAFSFCLKRNVWSCFTKGCHKEFGNDIFGLVRAIKGCSFSDSIQWLLSVLKLSNCDIKRDEESDEEDFLGRFSVNKKAGSDIIKKIYDRKVLNRLSSDIIYFKNRGYSQKVLEEFQCGLAKNGKMKNRIVFPVCDVDGNIVGFTGRSIFEKCDDCGYFHKPKPCNHIDKQLVKWMHSNGLKVEHVLFNLDKAKKYIQEKGEVIIVEGIADCMRLWEAGVKNVVCLLGANFSNNHLLSLLAMFVINCVWICTDNDPTGRNFANKHLTLEDDDSIFNLGLISRYFNTKTVNLGDKKDFGEMTTEEAICFSRGVGWI